MKRWVKTILCCLMLLALCGCGSSFSKVDLQKPVELPENGIVEQNTWKQIKTEQAIAVFLGKSNGVPYEWTIFGSDLSECRDVNLNVEIEKEEDAVEVKFAEKDPLGFSALLSIHLNDLWTAQSATVYQKETPVASVSITGTKETILNFAVNEHLGTCRILPDELLSDAVIAEEAMTESAEVAAPVDEVETKADVQSDYLSAVNSTTEIGKVYASESKNSIGRIYSDGSSTEKDPYLTDPVPAGKPLPVEPEDQNVNTKNVYSCTISIDCATILNNLADLDPDKLELVPSDGTILAATDVEFYEGESVYDVMQRVCRDNGIHMEASWTPIYNSAYVEGIHNLYEFDCGALSGWMYKVNGWYPNYGSTRYQLQDGDVVAWRYTCDLGNDIGGAYAVGG